MNRAFPTAFALILALILAGSLSASLAFAQQTQPPAPDAAPAASSAAARTPDPQRQVKRLSKELNLTPDQASKLEPILADRDQKIAAIRANTTLAPADAQKQLRAVQKSSRDQMSAILTPAQLDQLKTMQKSRGAKGQIQPLQPAPAA